MEQKTVVYKDVKGVEQLKIEIDKEHAETPLRKDRGLDTYSRKTPIWFVHEVVTLEHSKGNDYLVVYRKD